MRKLDHIWRHLASLFGVPGGVRAIGGPAGQAARKTALKKLQKRELEIACSILVELIEGDA